MSLLIGTNSYSNVYQLNEKILTPIKNNLADIQAKADLTLGQIEKFKTNGKPIPVDFISSNLAPDSVKVVIEDGFASPRISFEFCHFSEGPNPIQNCNGIGSGSENIRSLKDFNEKLKYKTTEAYAKAAGKFIGFLDGLFVGALGTTELFLTTEYTGATMATIVPQGWCAFKAGYSFENDRLDGSKYSDYSGYLSDAVLDGKDILTDDIWKFVMHLEDLLKYEETASVHTEQGINDR